MNDRFSASILLIRLAVGWVFFSEGLQKFLFPEQLGFGRFQKIGIPVPGFTAPFVGFVETICGLLLLLGLFSRWATIPLLTDMAVAIATTKIPMLFKNGFWAMAHEARVDFTMVLGLFFLLIVGGGSLSIDRILRYRSDRRAQKTPAAPTSAQGSSTS